MNVELVSVARRRVRDVLRLPVPLLFMVIAVTWWEASM